MRQKLFNQINPIKPVLLIFLIVLGIQHMSAQFTIANEDQVTSIVYDIENSTLDSIAAHLLAQDIQAVTGKQPKLYTALEEVEGNVIVIGDVTSKLIKKYMDTSQLSGWERYERIFVDAPAKGIDQAMFIAGSDPRGAAYGVFDLSREIGISPWYWWADAPIEQKDVLTVNAKDFISKAPTVKFRGIFINDEGWGLEPWSSKTFEPEVGNMGPKTYTKIFELLLRLKGNTIWPGMHPNTRPFFTVPGNLKTAEQWEIILGTSHAEPMLRNNVGEWNHQSMGSFNYQTNATSVYNYWKNRVKESKGVNAIYTVGMRGVHDSGMQGFNSMEEKVEGLEKVISDQRKLLSEYIDENISEVPQAFTPYKEVLNIYESGMEIPKDITIIWPDDNLGYIKRFSNQTEQQRSGGTGIYYHLSYLGAPHPYIWLSPISPSLVWREMTRASQQNMNEIWIANVGDIKRREWAMEFYMDLAWNIDSWNPENISDYFETVAARDISDKHGKQIADMMWEYYRLATQRKPEFMGFNEPQWNGKSPVRDPLYSLWNYNDEVAKRIDSYQELKKKAQKIKEEIPEDARNSYFELVYYPIAASTAMNEKWLYAYKSREYAKQGRASANSMSDSAFAAFQEIKELTHHYNHEIADGKWEYMVDYSPSYEKGSPVFWEPITKRIETDTINGLAVAIEGESEILRPVAGSQPDIITRESVKRMDASEARLSGEIKLDKDSDGEYLIWPEDGTNRQIQELHWDKIPYQIDSPTKAVFEFNFENNPGGVHTLKLSVDHAKPESDSWWVTLNDKPPHKIDGSLGRIQKLKVGDFVLNPGLNKLVIHPREDGAKLYGIEFVQKSHRLSPIYTDKNRLPVFYSYARQSHFIDIFSKGHETEKWSAVTSNTWIELSDDNGELYGTQDRIWVSINYDKAPDKKKLSGYVEITNGEQHYRVEVSAINQHFNHNSEGFAETNGVIVIPASQFYQKRTGKVASWKSVSGLGRSGSAMLLQPMDGWYVDDLSQVRPKSPVLEYDLVITQGGKAEVFVEAVPGFPLNSSQELHCALSINDGQPKWITFEMGNQHWSDNVLESRMIGSTKLNLDPGKYQLKLWGTDPSVSVDKIIINFGGLKESYNEPDPTVISTN